MFELDEALRPDGEAIRQHPWYRAPLPAEYELALAGLRTEQAAVQQQLLSRPCDTKARERALQRLVNQAGSEHCSGADLVPTPRLWLARGASPYGLDAANVVLGKVAVFEQPNSAWPVAMLKELDEEHLQGDGNFFNANATKISTNIKEYYRHPGRFINCLGHGTSLWLTACPIGNTMGKIIKYSQLQNSGWEFALRVVTDGVSISAHFVRSQAVKEPVELPFIGRELTATSDFNPATHIDVGLQQLAAATQAGTTLDGLHAHILVRKATWDALWEENLKPLWRRQRFGLHHAQERVIEGFCKKSAAGASGSGQQDDEGKGQGDKEVVGQRRQVIKAAFRGLVEAARPDLSPAQVDAVVSEVNKRTTMGSKQCCLAAVLCLSMMLQSFLGPPPPPDPACPPYTHPRLATRSSPRSAAAPTQLPPLVQLDILDPKVFEQLSDAWPVAMLKELGEEHLQGDGNSPNADATKISTNITSTTGTQGASSAGVTQAIKAAHAQRHAVTGQVLRKWEWELTKGQVKHDSELIKAKQDTARCSPAIQPQLQQLAAATQAGTTLDGLHAHILVRKATWDTLWEEYLKPRWRRQRLGLHHAYERVIEGFCKNGGWKAEAVREGFRKLVQQPSRPIMDDRPDMLMIVDEFRTSRLEGWAAQGQHQHQLPAAARGVQQEGGA
ncbi:hypothetical protein QJQ45_027237, partial [Haematococcus lacustris]